MKACAVGRTGKTIYAGPGKGQKGRRPRVLPGRLPPLAPPPPTPGSRAAGADDSPEPRFVVCAIVACLRAGRGGC